MPTCNITILDEVNCKVTGLKAEHHQYFSDLFAIHAPGYFFNPKFKLGVWDGKIKYFKPSGATFVRLLDIVIPKLVEFQYEIDVADNRSGKQTVPPAVDCDFFSNITDGESLEPWKMRDYQVDMVNALLANSGGIGLCGTGGGKATLNTAKVLTTEGWVTMKHITTDHTVITPDNGTAPVTGVYKQPLSQVYKVTFSDDTSLIVHPDHLWEITRSTSRLLVDRWTRVMSTTRLKTVLDKLNRGLYGYDCLRIPTVSPIDFRHDNEPLLVDPYLIGIIASIGSTVGGNRVSLNTADPDILNKITDILEGTDVELVRSNRRSEYTIRSIPNGLPGQNFNDSTFNDNLRAVGMMHQPRKSIGIPPRYLTASQEDRLAVIQGLMDGSGSIRKDAPSQDPNVYFTTDNLRLLKDMGSLVWSLGGAMYDTCATSSENHPRKFRYAVKVRLDDITRLFTVPYLKRRCQNLQKQRPDQYYFGRTVTSVELMPGSKRRTTCISIDHPKHLYVTDDFIVTHNTSMCAALALSYEQAGGHRSIIIVPDKNLTDQTRIEYEFFGLDVGEYGGTTKDLAHQHVVSTWQALQHNPTIVQDFEVVIVDECHKLKGAVLTKLLMDYGKHIVHRFGVTGTLPKEETDKMAVEVSVGTVQSSISASDLINAGHLSRLDINIMQLDVKLTEEYATYKNDFVPTALYAVPVTYAKFKESYFPDFQSEKQYNQTDRKRLFWIAQYISDKRDSQQGNVLCLVDGIKFGKKLAGLVDGAIFLSGSDKMDVRKEAYDMFAERDDVVVIATIQIASTGLNIKRIFNLIYIDVGKSFTRVIQTIGRGLRKAPDKDYIDVTDICSDLKYSKKHLTERVGYYKESKYPHTKKKINIT